MTEKRFTVDKDGRTILDNIDDNYCECVDGYEAKQYCDKLNELNKENYELKEVIVEVFEMVTNLDYVRKQYLNGLLDVLGEENDVEKTKKRIKEFLE